MKKFLLTILATFFVMQHTILAQTAPEGVKVSVTFFSENGEKFWVIINGQRQNDKPATNVKVSELTTASCKAKIIFEDEKNKDVDQLLYFIDAEDNWCDLVYSIRPDKKKKNHFVTRIVSFSPVKQNVKPQPAPQDQVIVPVHDIEPTPPPSRDETTDWKDHEKHRERVNPVPDKRDKRRREIEPNPNPTPAPKGCTEAVSSLDFQEALNLIKQQAFTEDQVNVTSQFLRHNCVTTEQVRQMLTIFAFEETKLEVAKMAYDKVTDKHKYFTLTNSFTFSSTRNAFNQFLNSK
jgi:hypothetical protein